MKTVVVAELKSTLSAKLALIKAGKELVVSEHGRPIARIVPFSDVNATDRLVALVRKGILSLPKVKAKLKNPVLSDPKGLLLKALLAEWEEGY